MKQVLIILSCLTITSCALEPTQSEVEELSQQARVRDTIPTCEIEKECQNKWDAAQVWVSQNSGYKIQTASSAIIETYNSTDGSTALAMKVLKEPLGSGKYRFVLSAGCANLFGCDKRPIDVIQRFNDYINGIK